MHIEPSVAGILHFIGIGGIGMSGIAEVLQSLGYTVQGSDKNESKITRRLSRLGISIFKDHQEEHIQGVSAVIISSAIKGDNPELRAARARGIPVLHRAEMLAEIMRLRPSIAISGSHGKTSTTSLGATVLTAGGFEPTVVNGGVINAWGASACLGTGKWMIVEADESDGSFTKLPATMVIVTNIDPEHMDHYGTFDRVRQDFIQFIQNIPFYGLAILCLDHPEVKALLPHVRDRRYVTYGFSEEAQIRAINVNLTATGSSFDVILSPEFHQICPTASRETRLEKLQLAMLGSHNVQNALSIIAMALELGIPIDKIRTGLAEFQGVDRRFTQVAEINGITIVDDYAHHPVEIQAVLKTARLVSKGRVVVVFQPHRYSRFSDFYTDFLTAFEQADQLFVTPIYGAGEEVISSLSSQKFVEDFQKISQNSKINCQAVDTLEELGRNVSLVLKPQDLLIFLGAGDITTWAYGMPDLLKKNLSEGSLQSTGTAG